MNHESLRLDDGTDCMNSAGTEPHPGTEACRGRFPVTRRLHRSAGPGFTLVELMVTLAVAAVLAFVAVPSFTQMRLNAQLTTAINNALSSINVARAEALRTQSSVYVQPVGGSWANGWMVYVDQDGSGTYTAANDKLVAQQDALPSAVTVNAGATTLSYVRFTGDGYPRKTGSSAFLAGTLALTNGTRNRQLVLAIGGRVRVCDPDASSTATGATTPPC